jgi:hypothetical protein
VDICRNSIGLVKHNEIQQLCHEERSSFGPPTCGNPSHRSAADHPTQRTPS